MPLAVDNLTPDSPMNAIRTAISSSYEQCMKEGGRTAQECGGMIYSIAEKQTGKSLKEKQ